MARLQTMGVPREFADSFAALKAVPLFFFGVVNKYKKRWKVDKRVVLVTDCYLFTARTKGEISRCIDLKMISEVLIEHPQQRLALKIPQQYDLCIQTPDYMKLATVLQGLVEALKKEGLRTVVLPPSEKVGSSNYEVRLHKPSTFKLEIKEEEKLLADETVTPPEKVQDMPQELRPMYRPSVTPSVPSVVDDYDGQLPTFPVQAPIQLPQSHAPQTPPQLQRSEPQQPIIQPQLQQPPPQAQQPQRFPQPKPQPSQQTAAQEYHPASYYHRPQENYYAAPLPTQELFAVPPTSSMVTVSAPVTGVDPTHPPQHVVHTNFGQHHPAHDVHSARSPPEVVHDATSLLPPYQGVEADKASTITVHVPFERETFTPYDSTDHPSGSIKTQEPVHESVPEPIDPMGRWPGVSTPLMEPEPEPLRQPQSLPQHPQPPKQLPAQANVFHLPPSSVESAHSSRQPTPVQRPAVQQLTPLDQPLPPPAENVPSLQPSPLVQPHQQEPAEFVFPQPAQFPLPPSAHEESIAAPQPAPNLPGPLDPPKRMHIPGYLTPSDTADMRVPIALPYATIDTSMELPNFDDQVQIPDVEPSIPTAKPSEALEYQYNREASPPPDYVELPWGKHSPAGKIAAAEHTKAREAELRAARLMSEIMSGVGMDQQVLQEGYGPVATPLQRQDSPSDIGFPVAPKNGIKSMRGVSPPRPGRSETPVAASPRTGVKNMLNELLAADTPPKEVKESAPSSRRMSRRTTLDLSLPVESSWPDLLPQDVKIKLTQALKCDTAAAIGIAPHQVEIEAFTDVDGNASVNFVLSRPDEGDEDVLSARYMEMNAHSRIPIPETMRIIRDSGGLQSRSRRGSASASQASAQVQAQGQGQPPRGLRVHESSTSASSYDPRYNSPSVDSALWRGETPSIPHELAEQQVMFAEQRAADLLAALQHDTEALQADLKGTIEKERREKEDMANEVNKLKQELREMTIKDLERSRRHSNARRDMENELTELKRQIAHQSSSVFADERRKLDNQVLALKEDIRNLESKGLDKDMKNSEEKRVLENNLLQLKEQVQQVSMSMEKNDRGDAEKRLEGELELLRQKVKQLDEKHVEKEYRNEEDDRKLLLEIEKVKKEMMEMNAVLEAKDNELKKSIYEREQTLHEGTTRIEKELEAMKRDMMELTAESSKTLLQNSNYLENELLSIKESVGRMMTRHAEATALDTTLHDEQPVPAPAPTPTPTHAYPAAAAIEAERDYHAAQAALRDAEVLNLQKSYTDMINSLEMQVQHLHNELMQTKERERLTQMQMEHQQLLSQQREIEATAKAEAQKYMTPGGLPPLPPRPLAPQLVIGQKPRYSAPPPEALDRCQQYTDVMRMLGDVYAKVTEEAGNKETRLRSVLNLGERGEGDTEVARLEEVLMETRREVDFLKDELTVCGDELIAVREKRLHALLAAQGKSLPRGFPAPPYHSREATLPPSDIRPSYTHAQPKHSSVQRLHRAESRLNELQEHFAPADSDVMSQVQACLNRTAVE